MLDKLIQKSMECDSVIHPEGLIGSALAPLHWWSIDKKIAAVVDTEDYKTLWYTASCETYTAQAFVSREPTFCRWKCVEATSSNYAIRSVKSSHFKFHVH